MLQYLHIEKEIEYTGKELSPHWIYKNFDLSGDAAVSFIGPCRVDISHMVDLADVKNDDHIYSPKMLHFIIEMFHDSLDLMIHRQHLFIVALKEELEAKSIQGRLIRKGDDIFHVGLADVVRKLSVSIATKSPVSTLIHTGLNIQTQGTPVPAVGLEELGIEPAIFAQKAMERFKNELNNMRIARCKVRGV